MPRITPTSGGPGSGGPGSGGPGSGDQGLADQGLRDQGLLDQGLPDPDSWDRHRRSGERWPSTRGARQWRGAEHGVHAGAIAPATHRDDRGCGPGDRGRVDVDRAAATGARSRRQRPRPCRKRRSTRRSLRCGRHARRSRRRTTRPRRSSPKPSWSPLPIRQRRGRFVTPRAINWSRPGFGQHRSISRRAILRRPRGRRAPSSRLIQGTRKPSGSRSREAFASAPAPPTKGEPA